MRIRVMMAIVTATLLLSGSLTAAQTQAGAPAAGAASAPQAAPAKAAADQPNSVAPVARPSSTEKSQAAVTESTLAPRSPNVPK